MKVFLSRFFYDLDLTPFYKLFEMIYNEKIELGTLEDSDILLESLFGGETALYKKKWLHSYLFIGESDRRLNIWLPNSIDNEIIKDFSCVLKGEKDNKNIINFPLYILHSYCYNFTKQFKQIDKKKFTKIPPKNICIITSATDSEGREDFFAKLEEKFQIDYAGNYKNNVPRIEDVYCTPKFIDFVSQYKIIITMENSKNKDYITEKILHGFAANTIPVYWGSDNIHEYFNEERFINVKSFNDNDVNEAIEKIGILLNDEEKYLEMINKPIYKNNEIPLTLYDISKNIKKLLNIDNKQNKKFITFGGPSESYHNNVKRICEEVNDLNFFNEITGYTDLDLKKDTTYWNEHSNFIENNTRGYGYWMWKSYIIKKELDKLNENDILIYCDSGCKINNKGKRRLEEYIDLLNTNKENYGLISFQLEYKQFLYTKKETLEYFNCTEDENNMLQCIGGIQIIKKNSHSVDIINKWYDICHNNYNLINDIKSDNQDPEFQDHRHDQSIISILVNKYGSIKLKDETWFSNWNVDGILYPIWAVRNR